MTQKATRTILLIIICILSDGISHGLSAKNTGKQTNEFQYLYKNVIFTCRENDGTVSITKFDGRAKTVEFPSEVTDRVLNKSYPVKSIDTYATNAPYMTEEVIISEGIETIEKKCFINFRSLNKVVLPSTVRWIDKKAFANMTQPGNIEFPTMEIKDLLVLSGIKYERLAAPVEQKKQEVIPNNKQMEIVKNGVAVIKVVSFTRSEALSARIDQRKDNNNNLCALIKVIVNGDVKYSSDFIPEPTKNFIAYNKKGRDYIWMVANATNLEIYSDNRMFEPVTINFNSISKGQISALERGVVYELKLRIVYEQ